MTRKQAGLLGGIDGLPAYSNRIVVKLSQTNEHSVADRSDSDCFPISVRHSSAAKNEAEFSFCL